MDEIFFTSRLGPEYRDDLEALLFFHPEQSRYEPGILQSLEEYGPPEVQDMGEGISLRVQALVELQVLFAFQGSPDRPSELIAAVLFHRPDERNLSVVHVAVRQGGVWPDRCRMIRKLLVELRRIARLIRGVEWINVKYTDHRIRV